RGRTKDGRYLGSVGAWFPYLLRVVDGDINAVTVLVDELRHEDPKLRLQAIKKVQVIGANTAYIVQGEFVDLVGGALNAYHLLFLLESLVAVDEASVRDTVGDLFTSALHRYTSRIAASGLFQVCYDQLNPATQAEMRSMFIQLCRDDLPLVRKAAAAALGGFASMMDPASATAEIFPDFLTLANDRQDSVRCQTVENAVALAGLVPVDVKLNQVLPVIVAAAKDSAWRVRWSVGNKLPEICAAMGAELATSVICTCFIPLLGDSEAEVKTVAASRAHGAAQHISPAQLISKVVPACAHLARDPSEHVRASLASVVMKIAPYLGRELAVQHLLPLFLQLLSDESSEVRLNIISNLEKVNDVVGIDQLSQSLLPAIVQLAEDRQWRVRLAIIEFIPTLASQLGVLYFEEHLMEMCMGWLCDVVFSIREAATLNLQRLAQHFGVAWTQNHIVPRIVSMHVNANYLYRMISLHAAKVLAPLLTSDQIQQSILPLVLQLASVRHLCDPVPNIRFNVAKALETMSGQLDSAAKEAHVVPALHTLTNDPDGDVQYFAGRALHLLQQH
ncbi:hypothetical protein DYB32_008052, partial [Aphanomyces invadans]